MTTIWETQEKMNLIMSKNISSFPWWKIYFDIEDLKEPGDASRAEFLQRLGLRPPEYLRVVDCKASVEEGAVVLIDWDVEAPAERGGGYTAISHTYGMLVYGVFDCGCAAKCFTRVARANPVKTPCKGHDHDEDPRSQQRVITDVLKMCQLLLDAGALHAWHDGVCIAQYDSEEVRHFIRHMGWIYANAKETVIFLHYIGRPMAPIAPAGPNDDHDLLTSRWQTRVWTFQEAALSKRRRYCVRMGDCLQLQGCSDLLEFEHRLGLWYEAGDSNIAIIEEFHFWELVMRMLFPILELWRDDMNPSWKLKLQTWGTCLLTWTHLLKSSCISFPTIVDALEICSLRESKHEGDRINSILGLAGIQRFDAPKDEDVEESTMELFKRMGKNGLVLALFTTNRYAPQSSTSTCKRKHTWVPCLSGHLMLCPNHFQRELNFHTENIEIKVHGNGEIELIGLVACVPVQFSVEEEGEAETEEEGEAETEEEEEAEAGGDSSKTSLAWSAKRERLNVQLRFNRNQINASFTASHAGHARVKLGDALLPTLSEESSLPIVQEWCIHDEMQDMNQLSFSAFLIFPADVLALEHCPDVLELDYPQSGPEHVSGFPAVLVQGDVHSSEAVAKVGCFIGSKALHGSLRQQQVHITFQTNLLIR